MESLVARLRICHIMVRSDPAWRWKTCNCYHRSKGADRGNYLLRLDNKAKKSVDHTLTVTDSHHHRGILRVDIGRHQGVNSAPLSSNISAKVVSAPSDHRRMHHSFMGTGWAFGTDLSMLAHQDSMGS